MEVTDAYQAYVEARREQEDVEKVSTLTLVQSDMMSIGTVIAEAVAAEEEHLSAEAKRKWGRILRGLQNAVQEAA